MEINIRTNFPDVAARLGQLQEGIASQVLARTLNAVMAQARTAMSVQIRSEFNLSAAYVRERLTVRRAFAKSGQFSISASLGRSWAALVITVPWRRTTA